jgi:hypothetical protein
MYELDASDWPLIINRGDDVYALIEQPAEGVLSEEEAVANANHIVRLLNDEYEPW